MYLPPLCLEVVKDQLTKLFVPGRSKRVLSALERAERHAECVVGAARCAASLALCGNAQLAELGRSLHGRVVDPGHASRHSRLEETARLVLRPHMKALISEILEETSRPSATTFSLAEAMFAYALPMDVLWAIRGVDYSWPHRLPKGQVLSIALSRAVDVASEVPLTTEKRRVLLGVVGELFPLAPPEKVPDCLQMLIDSDQKVATVVWEHTSYAYRHSLSHVRHTMQAVVDEMERRRRLNAALDEAGFSSPTRVGLYEVFVEGGNPRGLTVERVVTSAVFENALRRPLLLKNTGFGHGITDALDVRWVADVHEVVFRSADAASELAGMRDRMRALVAAIDEATTPSSTALLTLGDVLALPRGSRAYEGVVAAHAACDMDEAGTIRSVETAACLVGTEGSGPPGGAVAGPPGGAVALLEELAAATSEFRRTRTHEQVSERLGTLTREAMAHEVARFRTHQEVHEGLIHSIFVECPTCECPLSQQQQTFMLHGLFSHIVARHWQPFLPRDSCTEGGVGSDEGGPEGPTSSSRHGNLRATVATAKA